MPKDDFLTELKADNLDVEDILIESDKRNKRKKRINSGAKGKNSERQLCHEFITRFSKLLNENPSIGMFSRSLGSGNRLQQGVYLSKAAIDVFAGDLCTPTQFLFCIENKFGYNDYDLNSAFINGHKGIDEFIEQVSTDAKKCGKKPMLLWKKNNKPRLAFLLDGEVPEEFEKQLPYVMRYREWKIYPFESILKLPDSFFFDLSKI